MATQITPPAAADSMAIAPLSLRIPSALVVVYWCAYVAASMAGLHMFPMFLVRLGSTLLLGLALLIWWLRARRFRLRARWGIVALLFVGGAIATVALDHTVLPPVAYMWSLPLIMTLGTLWLLVARNVSPVGQLLGLCGAIVIGWLPGPLSRMEGLKGDGSNDVYSRWSASAEDKFLRQLPKQTAAPESVGEPIESSADDWLLFRGPDGNSEVPGLVIATDWAQQPPKLLWKRSIGPAWSSIIVVGSRLFTQEQRGEIEAITCYSTETGEQLWAHETKDRYEEPLGGVGPRATPTFSKGRIYALSARGRLDCVDARSGKSIWSVDALKDKQGRMPMWGYSVSPVVVDDRAIIFIGGETTHALAAYDAGSGAPAWTDNVGLESYASPNIVTIHGVKQTLYLGDSKLVSVDPLSGAILWEHASHGGRGRPTCQPQLVGDDRLLISFGPNELIQIEVSKQDDTWSTQEIWTTRDIKPDYSDYLVHDGYIYGFDGNIFCCIDLETGKRRWKQGRYGAGQALLLPEMSALLVSSEQGEVVLLACNSERHTELARMQAIEGKTWNHPTICRGRLYVRNAEQMACFQLPVVSAAVASQ